MSSRRKQNIIQNFLSGIHSCDNLSSKQFEKSVSPFAEPTCCYIVHTNSSVQRGRRTGRRPRASKAGGIQRAKLQKFICC